MKYGKGSTGLKGITLQQRWVKKWGYSLHVSIETLKSLECDGMQKEVYCT